MNEQRTCGFVETVVNIGAAIGVLLGIILLGILAYEMVSAEIEYRWQNPPSAETPALIIDNQIHFEPDDVVVDIQYADDILLTTGWPEDEDDLLLLKDVHDIIAADNVITLTVDTYGRELRIVEVPEAAE